MTSGWPSLLRGVLRDRDGELRVTNVELFFDLLYVFAVTQLSHNLVEHLTVRGAVETLVLFLAVWWAWNYTAWATNSSASPAPACWPSWPSPSWASWRRRSIR